MSSIALVLVLIILALLVSVHYNASISLPEWAKEPCSDCGSCKVKWLKGQEASSTGEAAFYCTSCGHKEHRGGMASELAMETWEAKT